MFSSLKVWDQVSQNRHVKKVIGNNVTALYSGMAILYFFIQVLVLISAADKNHSAGQLLESVLQAAHISTTTDFAYLESVKEGGHLRICPGIAAAKHISDCPVVFPVSDIDGPIATTIKRDEEYTMIPVFSGSNLTSFMMLETSDLGDVISLPPVCVRALEWPYQTLMQTRRIDVIFGCFQAWLLIMSIIAVFCQSIPHIGAAFVMHVVAFIWSSSQIAATVNFRSDYSRLITSTNGACDGVDLLVGYFKYRLSYEIAMTVINLGTALMSAYLTWCLFSVYGWTNFKESNNSYVIRRAYIFVLALSTIMQLTTFFHIASISLWLDEITKHIMGATSSQVTVYLILYIAIILSVVAWFGLAWRGVRQESLKMMISFFFISLLYFAGAAGMVASETFRQTFVQWSFFGAIFTITYLLLVITIVLAVICQLNFGIGLHRYLDPSGTGGFHHSSRASLDLKADLESGPSGDFVVSLPGEKTLQRDASVSSSSSTLRSDRSYGYTKGGAPAVIAAQPGSVKILPPIPAVMDGFMNSDGPRPKGASTPLRKYGKDLWGRTRRHESAMSFGHMDASKLSVHMTQAPTSKGALQLPLGLTGPFTLDAEVGSILETPSLARPPPSQRVDSMGSVYSTQSNKQRLVLVTPL